MDNEKTTKEVFENNNVIYDSCRYCNLCKKAGLNYIYCGFSHKKYSIDYMSQMGACLDADIGEKDNFKKEKYYFHQILFGIKPIYTFAFVIMVFIVYLLTDNDIIKMATYIYLGWWSIVSPLISFILYKIKMHNRRILYRLSKRVLIEMQATYDMCEKQMEQGTATDEIKQLAFKTKAYMVQVNKMMQYRNLMYKTIPYKYDRYE